MVFLFDTMKPTMKAYRIITLCIAIFLVTSLSSCNNEADERKQEAVSILEQRGIISELSYEKEAMAAARDGDTELLKLLITAGANINEEHLQWAAAYAHEETVIFLLEHGISVNPPSRKGKLTPLHFAASGGNENIVRLFLEKGADVNSRYINDGDTPLHGAARKGNPKCVELLLKAGANIDSQNIHGDTPLHIAAMQGHHQCAKALLKAGANPHIKNEDGKTPIQVAHGKCTEILEMRGVEKEMN